MRIAQDCGDLRHRLRQGVLTRRRIDPSTAPRNRADCARDGLAERLEGGLHGRCSESPAASMPARISSQGRRTAATGRCLPTARRQRRVSCATAISASLIESAMTRHSVATTPTTVVMAERSSFAASLSRKSVIGASRSASCSPRPDRASRHPRAKAGRVDRLDLEARWRRLYEHVGGSGAKPRGRGRDLVREPPPSPARPPRTARRRPQFAALAAARPRLRPRAHRRARCRRQIAGRKKCRLGGVQMSPKRYRAGERPTPRRSAEAMLDSVARAKRESRRAWRRLERASTTTIDRAR